MRHKKMQPKTIEIPMTKTRRKVLKTIAALIEREGISPTINEIAAEADLSFGTVQSNLLPLEIAGYITRRAGSARSIQVLRTDVPAIEARA